MWPILLYHGLIKSLEGLKAFKNLPKGREIELGLAFESEAPWKPLESLTSISQVLIYKVLFMH